MLKKIRTMLCMMLVGVMLMTLSGYDGSEVSRTEYNALAQKVKELTATVAEMQGQLQDLGQIITPPPRAKRG